MKKKHLPIWHYIIYICIIILILCGFTLLLSSCLEIAIIDKSDAPNGPGTVKGTDGNLNFSIIFGSFDPDDLDDDVSTRSAADLMAETVVVPLGDGLTMSATLELVTTEAVRTRSATLRSFETGALLNIVA